MAEPFVCLGAVVVRAAPVIEMKAMVDDVSADPTVFAMARRARTPDRIQVEVLTFHNFFLSEVIKFMVSHAPIHVTQPAVVIDRHRDLFVTALLEPFVCLGAYVVRAIPVIGVRAMVDHVSADLIVFAMARRAGTPDLIQVEVVAFHKTEEIIFTVSEVPMYVTQPAVVFSFEPVV